VPTGLQLDRLPEVAALVASITGIPIGYFKGVTGGGAMSVEQWGATARLAAVGQRRAAFAYEPELVGRSPRLVVGKWSDLGAVEKRLGDFGLEATADQLAVLLRRCQEAGLAAGRPLTDPEFLALARGAGAVPTSH